VQEACLSAWDRLGQLRSPESARSWFLAIVANRCRSATRGRWWEVLKRAEVASAGAAPGPETGVDVLALRASLRRLSLNDRMVLYLRYCEDLSQEEIALTVGVRVGTVKSRIHRALHRLRGELSEEENQR
jgi:RNA polymerase sigma-70 factor (ECF subfamily)